MAETEHPAPFSGGRARPLVIAHRGASGHRPEHSASAYRLAIEMGADAVEPDLVATRDGVLVIRHENEISGTTDVARHPEFAARRTTKRINGRSVTGWFTEDFTWEELSGLRVRERLPQLRPHSAAHDDTEPMLRLADLLELTARSAVGLVLELKHAQHFASIGLPLDELLVRELDAAGRWGRERVVIESFELGVLRRLRGADARRVFLLEPRGAPADDPRRSYTSWLSPAGLRELAAEVDGVSPQRGRLLDAAGRSTGVVERAADLGLETFTWTLRPENAFLPRRHRSVGGPSLGAGGPMLRPAAPGAERRGDWMSDFRELAATGVDGVFADYPDLALAARAAR